MTYSCKKNCNQFQMSTFMERSPGNGTVLRPMLQLIKLAPQIPTLVFSETAFTKHKKFY